MKRILTVFLTAAVLTLAASPLPKLVVVHAMGMMPAGGGNLWTWSGLYPLNDYGRMKHFSSHYGGGGMRPLGCFNGITREDGSYNFNYMPSPKNGEKPLHPERLQPPFRGYTWDLLMAEEQGIDALGLCLSGNDRSALFAYGWFRTLERMLKENPKLKIRLTLTICGNDLAERAKNPKKYVWVRKFMDDFRDSPAWLRHDGRIILHGYKSHVSWEAKDYIDPEFTLKTVKMHQDFFKELKLDNPIFLYDGAEYTPKGVGPEALAKIAGLVCESFDGYGCWGGVIPDQVYQKNYPVIAAEVNRRGKAWMMPILNIHSGKGQFYMSRPGVQRLVDTWNMAMKTNATVAQPVTWNDTSEATCFVPVTSLNYAFASLNAKFIYRFKHGAFQKPVNDEVFLFYRKYHADVIPELYARCTVERDSDRWGETDDMLHVFVFAKANGEVRITGTSEGEKILPVKQGYNEFKLKTATDKEIAARIYRNGKLEHELISPERVTAHPYREDLIPWGWSSLCRSKYDRDFCPAFRPLSEYSERYNDGIPDWFRLFYFGTTEPVPGSGTHDDPDGDGVDNLMEYQLGENPRVPNKLYQTGTVWNEWQTALSPIADKTQPAGQRVNMNPYPDQNGKLVHGFLYKKNEDPLDGKYPWLMKWTNLVKGCLTGWGFRTGKKYSIYLTEDKKMGMLLQQGLSGIYRFRAPVDGTYRAAVSFTGDTKSSSSLTIMSGAKKLWSSECRPGENLSTEVEVRLKRLESLDFIVSGKDRLIRVQLVPQITLK